MYELRQPTNENEIIWRFLDFPKFFDLINRKSLFFTRADLLGDPFEGYLIRTIIRIFRNYDHDYREELRLKLESLGISPYSSATAKKKISVEAYNDSIKEKYNIDLYKLLYLRSLSPQKAREYISSTVDESVVKIRSCYVNCWHLGEFESYPMWKTYANSLGSIAIRSTYGKLKESLPSTFTIGKVDYFDLENISEINHRVENELPPAYFPFFCKRVYFTSENEIRVVTFRNYEISRVITGFAVKVDLPRLIDAIYISPSSPDWHLKVISNYLKEKSISINLIEHSALDRIPLT
jgi:hypothetical protein